MAHQLIHYKFVHKFYFTPVRRFKLKLINSDSCTKCPGSVRGDYLHMFWYCSTIKTFWDYVTMITGSIIDKNLPSCPALCLLGYNPNILLTFQQKRIILAASTAAKKTIIKNWFEPTIVMKNTWLAFFLDVCLLERSTARFNGASVQSVTTWSKAIEIIQGLK